MCVKVLYSVWGYFGTPRTDDCSAYTPLPTCNKWHLIIQFHLCWKTKIPRCQREHIECEKSRISFIARHYVIWKTETRRKSGRENIVLWGRVLIIKKKIPFWKYFYITLNKIVIYNIFSSVFILNLIMECSVLLRTFPETKKIYNMYILKCFSRIIQTPSLKLPYLLQRQHSITF